MTSEAEIKKLQDENRQLRRLIFESAPIKSRGLRYFLGGHYKKAHGFGGVTQYEAWLRQLEYKDLRTLIEQHQSVIDALRYRARFLRLEMERRHLHSNYGEYSVEDLINIGGSNDNLD